MDSATVSDTGQALVKVTYTCPEGKGIWGAGFRIAVNVTQNGVEGTSAAGVCGDDGSGSVTVRVNGRTGSGMTGRDAKFVKGTAQIQAFITDNLQGPDLAKIPTTMITAPDGTQLS
ncbi:hypothetical protein [Streptomyces microflavus]|uniref:Lipoprotein n=1 Tax=Streptomyces microflavus TaxID=1919 RepID=A0ABV1QBJ7_STRMI